MGLWLGKGVGVEVGKVGAGKRERRVLSGKRGSVTGENRR
jgi:hypothetical protein